MVPWFDVDKAGLARILARRGGIAWAVLELWQNAVDEAATRIDIEFKPLPGGGYGLMVEDDSPDGFKNIAHAYTLFAPSSKAGNPQQRGRFNLGEKLVLAVCREASIVTTTGAVHFGPSGRRRASRKRERGSLFYGYIPKVSADDAAAVLCAVQSVVVPANVSLTYNGAVVENNGKQIAGRCEVSLPTDVLDSEGRLVRSQRKATVLFRTVAPGERAWLYELGIPVVEHDGMYHYDVQQKVPLNWDRDNVPPAYLSKLHALALDAARNAGELTEARASQPWASVAAARPESSAGAVAVYLDAKYGKKRASYDPSDIESNKRATAMGYRVVSGGSESAEVWAKAREAGLIQPAGQVAPTPKPYSADGRPLNYVAADQWTEPMLAWADYAIGMAHEALGYDIDVKFVRERDWPFAATFGSWMSLVVNLEGLDLEDARRRDELLIHELAHVRCADHLSDDYHKELCRVGAAFVRAARTGITFIRAVRAYRA